MKISHLTITLIFFVALFSSSYSRQTPNKQNDHYAPKYVVDLDADPYNRWTHIAEKYNGEMIEIWLDIFMRKLEKESKYYEEIVERLTEDLDNFLGVTFAQELRGLSAALNIETKKLLLANFMYELTAFNSSTSSKACTSIVAEDEYGNIYHGRNLDYDGAQLLREFIIEIDFQRNGRTLYKAISLVGSISVPTGVKSGAFSITGNQRNTGSVLDNIFSAILGSQMNFLLIRRILETASTYDEALNILSSSPVIAPMYYIIAGIESGEGAIVVRDPLKNVETITLRNQTNLSKWFLIETNYEPWQQPPPQDNRREVGILEMKKVGQKQFSLSKMEAILGKYPIINHRTVYTASISAASFNLTTIIRYNIP